MELTPREKDKLLLFTAALLAAVGFFTGMVAWLKLARSPSLMLKA